MSQQITITGTDLYGNEISDQLDVPDDGEVVTSKNIYVSIKPNNTEKEADKRFHTLRKLYVPYQTKKGKWKYKQVLHGRIYYALWNLRCRIYWLFHKREDEDGEVTE